MKKGKNRYVKNLMIILAVLIIAFIPLLMNRGADFRGTDGEAERVINEVSPGYSPWLNSFRDPPGAGTESLLFALQAALGSGVIGYYFGYRRGKKQREKC